MADKSSHRPKLSVAQMRLLCNLRDKRWIASHCKTMSDHGGLRGTVMWARRNGLMHPDKDCLTARGRKLLCACED